MAVHISRDTPEYKSAFAYVNSFAEQDESLKEIYVNAFHLDRGKPKRVADVVSHMLGHALGLRDALERDTNWPAYLAFRYHGGTPDGKWAPIMGLPWSAEYTQFSRGEYEDATQKEFSFEVMERNGLPLRQDDFGGTRTKSEPLKSAVGTFLAEGVIERPNDQDTFHFNAGVGTFQTFLEWQAGRGSNVNLEVSLHDSEGKLLKRQFEGLYYPITRPGTYYLRVSGKSLGTPGKDGFSNYGNCGAYKFITDYPATQERSPAADIVASHFRGAYVLNQTAIAGSPITFDARNSQDDKGIVDYSWDFGDGTSQNAGSATTVDKTYTKTGTYTISLRVTDADGLSGFTRRTLTVVPDQVVSLGAAVSSASR